MLRVAARRLSSLSSSSWRPAASSSVVSKSPLSRDDQESSSTSLFLPYYYTHLRVGARIHTTATKEAGNFGTSSHMNFVKNPLDKREATALDKREAPGQRQDNAAEKLDIVHIKLIKNNTFVSITDSKGNKKVGASSGCLEEMKGGPKLSRYAAEATAEHVGRLARNLGLKSVVMRVNGFTHFKKKKQAILSWREGYTFGKGDHTPIAYIEDTTRRPHNGCRLPKKRRV
ncbi:probable ribosomal protein S11, mitochondrial [Chenopodium quinoa]|uniref:Ribosomal protein S11 n=1 Tax=Chenopodium quinoa TaxID=63459 RepID=A0A803N0M6_CHEQI|nr:probable ribosomal protein S11, mitochondrial [Chenopodium quinoa]